MGCGARVGRSLVAMVVSVVGFLGFVGGFATSPAHAQCEPDDRGWFGGGITRVYGNASNYCIANMGTRIARLNTTNPASVTIDWQTAPLTANYGEPGIAGRLNDVAVGNGFVYVTVADDLFVFNLATGAQVAVHPNLGSALATFGTTLYIADHFNLRVLNMTDPTQPVELGRAGRASPIIDTPTSIAVANGLAYVAGGDSLNESCVIAFDVANPAAPRRLGVYTVSDSAGMSPTVGVALNYVLFAPGNNSLAVLDFSIASAPAVRAVLSSTSRITHTRGSGSLFWVAAGAEGVKTYSISPSAQITLRGTYNTPGFAERLAGSQPFFVADRDGGLQLLNITGGAAPTFMGSSAVNPGIIRDFDTQGVFTYVLDNTALRIHSHLFDSAVLPLVRGSVAGLSNPHRFRVTGERGALFATIADGSGGLKIAEVSNADAPVLRGALPLSGVATHVALNALATTAAVATGGNGLRLVDVSNPALPVLRSTVTLSPLATFRGCVWSGTRVFACSSRGLTVINAASPAAPVVERTIPVEDGLAECVLAGSLLYAARGTYPGGFTVFDLSVPSNPTIVRTFDYSINGAIDLEIANNLLYLSAYGGVYIFDVSNPAQPAHVSGLDAPLPEQYDDERNMLMLDLAGGAVCFAQSERGVHFASVPTGWAPASRDYFTNARRCLHDSYVFTANVSANPATGLTYQWTKNNIPIPGATGPTYVLNDLRGVDRATYACDTTNACGTRPTSWVFLNICPADLDDGSGSGQCDGGVTVEDLLFYLVIFEDGNILADLDDGSGTGTPDDGVTIDDLLYFLVRYNVGC